MNTAGSAKEINVFGITFTAQGGNKNETSKEKKRLLLPLDLYRRVDHKYQIRRKRAQNKQAETTNPPYERRAKSIKGISKKE